MAKDADKKSAGLDDTLAAGSGAAPPAAPLVATLASPSPVAVGTHENYANAKTQAASEAGPQEVSGLAPGRVIARYRLISPLGDGGMGTVWRARDTELARDVAIKLVQPRLLGSAESGSANTSRLFREAQALAQLSHPNIVPVYDVGTTEQGEVWVAMEHVVGMPGDRWASKKPRWIEVLAVYQQVGEGIAAAHRAGIVHRDFKPANFVVGEDGRVRVLDFGLARKSGAEEKPSPAASDDTELSALSDAMTLAGAILGTPAYMSPEQMIGEVAEAPSDQYSFAVAMWEALYKAHPYPATSFSELRALVKAGTIAAPKTNEVAPYLETALRKAMSTEVAQRFDNMEGLLKAIEPPAKKQRLAILALIAIAAIGAAAFVFFGGSAEQESCTRDDAEWAEALSPELVKALETRLPSVASEIVAELGDRRDKWITTRFAACQALQSGEDNNETNRRRVDCLDYVRHQAQTMAALLAKEDGLEGNAAYIAITELDRAEQCTGNRSWSDDIHSPEDQALADEIGAMILRQRVSSNIGLLEAVDPLVEKARTSSQASLGRALLLRADMNQRARKFPEAEKDLREALEVFAEAKINRFAAQTWTALVEVVGSQGRNDEARSLATAAKTTATFGDSQTELARLENTLANIYETEGNLNEAALRYASARAAFVEALGADSPRLIPVDANLGRLELLRGDHEAAIAFFERGLDIAVNNKVENTPVALQAWLGLANAYGLAGDEKRAIGIVEKVLKVQQKNLGPEHPTTIDTTFMLAHRHAGTREYERALQLMREGLAIHEKSADKRTIANDLSSLGGVETSAGFYAEAVATLSRGQAIYDQLSDTSIAYAALLLSLGKAQRLSGNCKAAAEPIARAQGLLAGMLGDDHEFTCLAYEEQGQCAHATKQFADASRLFERAIAGYSDKASMQGSRADALFALGKAKVQIRKQQSQAKAHVQEALEIWDSMEDHDPQLRAEAAAWLESH